MQTILTPSVLTIMDTLNRVGHEARVAGGAVRDTLMGKTPKDIDLATTAHPAVVQEVFEQAGFQVIPTGLQHGTVTVVVDGEPFEITTLRVDQDTDGRHAVVEFTEDWQADAARRDFTINAMFVDRDGRVHDFFGGQDDLKNFRVRFVGNPADRIQEDFLRILRFFRFQARMPIAHDSLEERVVIHKHASGLKQISGERIWTELVQILQTPGGGDAMANMQNCGVLKAIGLDRFDFVKVLPVRAFTFDPVAQLVAGVRDMSLVDLMVNRFKVSREEREKAIFLVRCQHMPMNVHAFKELALDHPKDWVRLIAAIQGHFDAWVALENWTAPEFPVRGQDLLERGMKPGPAVGQTLLNLKAAWSQSGFSKTRAELLDMV